MKKTSEAGISLIKKFEGCRLKAYKDAVGVYTIGFGHTNGVHEGQVITQEQADSYLKADLAKFEANVNKYNSRYTWNQNEFDALVSFAFNIGNIDQLTTNGRRSRKEIAEKILLYNKAGGKELLGLTARRKAERALFLTVIQEYTNETVSATTEDNTTTDSSFKVKVTVNNLNIRKGPGTNYSVTGSIKDKGTYTIVKIQGNWGHLKSGAGWICLDYTKKL